LFGGVGSRGLGRDPVGIDHLLLPGGWNRLSTLSLSGGLGQLLLALQFLQELLRRLGSLGPVLILLIALLVFVGLIGVRVVGGVNRVFGLTFSGGSISIVAILRLRPSVLHLRVGHRAEAICHWGRCGRWRGRSNCGDRFWSSFRGQYDPLNHHGIGRRAEHHIVEMRAVQKLRQHIARRTGTKVSHDTIVRASRNFDFRARLFADRAQDISQGRIVRHNTELPRMIGDFGRNRRNLIERKLIQRCGRVRRKWRLGLLLLGMFTGGRLLRVGEREGGEADGCYK